MRIDMEYSDGLVQNCSNSIANALELLQSCTKPLMQESYDCSRVGVATIKKCGQIRPLSSIRTENVTPTI